MVQSHYAYSLYALLLVIVALYFLTNSEQIAPLNRTSKDNTLRILPLGDSLTWGLFSADGNAYRLKLQNLLADKQIHYIGSQRSGEMIENANEGHNAAKIEEIARFLQPTSLEVPDVVLLMAGTNDVINYPYDPSTAAESIANLIDKIMTAWPTATVLVAQIPTTGRPIPNTLIPPYNTNVGLAVHERAKSGKQILLVNMYSRMTMDDLTDGVHPTDHGFDLMAEAWFEGIQTAETVGWIS